MPRELVLSQHRAPGQASDSGGLDYGHAALGVNQVEDGGFSTLALFSNGALAFDGDVSLNLSRELRVYAGALTVVKDASTAIDLVFEPEWDKDMMSEEARLELGFL